MVLGPLTVRAQGIPVADPSGAATGTARDVSVADATRTATARAGVSQSPSPPPAAAVGAEVPGVGKRVTITTGLDFTSSYLFRGIHQQSHGAIGQPYVDLGVLLAPGVLLDIGNWDSLHSGAPSGWYESDYFGSLTLTAGKLKPGLLYTCYTSPADSFSTVHELAGVLSIDDSATAFPLSPKIVVAFELGNGQADGGATKGTYVELGVRPAVKVAPKLMLAIPVKIGLSARGYYEGPVSDDRFGYLDAGLIGSVPVISGSGGTLEAHGGFDVVRLGDNMRRLNGGDRTTVVGSIGFSFIY